MACGSPAIISSLMRPVSKARAAGPPRRPGLWGFSLAFYARPGVAPALIALQDRAGLDVNLILYALWLGASGRGRLDRGRLTEADRAVAAIRSEITEPLRALRRRLKARPDADIRRLREAVGRLELDAEKAALRRLARLAGPGARGAPRAECRAAALANLALCLGREAAGAEAAALRDGLEGHLQGGSAGSPQRRTAPVSRPNRSRTRPRV